MLPATALARVASYLGDAPSLTEYAEASRFPVPGSTGAVAS